MVNSHRGADETGAGPLMGLFGNKEKDTSQDADLKNLWTWIASLNNRLTAAEKNQAILVKNNAYFIERDKLYAGAVGQLQAKDKLHDQKDAEHDQLINSIKSMAKAVEQAEATT